jgi:S1-C subfamily serine protease
MVKSIFSQPQSCCWRIPAPPSQTDRLAASLISATKIAAACMCAVVLGTAGCNLNRHTPYETNLNKVIDTPAYKAEEQKYAVCVATRTLALNAPSESVELVVDTALAGCSTNGMEQLLGAANFDPNLTLVLLLSSEATARRAAIEGLLRIRAAGVAAPPQGGSLLASPSEVFGTGFFVSGDRKALTNAHVVEGCAQIRISLGSRVAVAQVVARDTQNDLALIQTEIQPTDTAHFRLSVRQGEDVIVYGFPLAGLLSSGGNVTAGNVTALSGIADDSRFLQLSAPVQPGNSGAPLFDQSGNVIGIVVGKLDALKIAGATNDIPQNVNFAIKSSVAASFLESNGIAYASGKTGDHLSAADIAERAKTFTVQIECQR